MLDMGFSEDIMTIAKQIPASCQTIMFSATMPDKIEDLAKTLLKNPKVIKLAVSKPAEKIKQSAYVCYETQKMGIIKDIFKAGDLKRVIIFCGSKMKVKQLAGALQRKHVNCGEMHSDLEQAERDDIMYKFKSDQIDVLVATDIVARGIDIDDISMVINYDVPHDAEDYVHRIGRTARADRDGVAITLVSEEDMYYFQQIEKFLEKEVTKNPLPEGLGEGEQTAHKRKPKRTGEERQPKQAAEATVPGQERETTATGKSRRPRRKPNRPTDANQQTAPGNERQASKESVQLTQNNEERGQQAGKPRRQGKPRRAPQGDSAQRQGEKGAPANASRRDSAKREPGKNGRNNRRGNHKAAEQPRKVEPIVNPPKRENGIKKLIKRIFGMKK